MNNQYYLELREYTQYEIDHPECDRDALSEHNIIWAKPHEAQCAQVVNVANVKTSVAAVHSESST